MISMTTYWQQFEDCINSLQLSATHELISTAKHMIEIGVRIEKLGITEIKSVVNQLHEKTQLFGHQVTYTADKEYTFYLPKITDTESLIFAIVYYQHLSNYHDVSYQGSINWFRQTVIDAVNQKKRTTKFQADAVLQEIQTYCQNQNISIDEALFLKGEQESISDYTKRITALVSSYREPEKTDDTTEKLSDMLTTLEVSIDQMETKRLSLIMKANAIEQKQWALNQAKQRVHVLKSSWDNQWRIAKFLYWLISWFFEPTLLKNLKIAQKELVHAEHLLNQELPPHSPQDYINEFKKQADELQGELINVQEQLLECLKPPQASVIAPPPIDVALDEPENEEQLEPDATMANDYCSFFKRNCPSAYTLGAVAASAAAVAIKSYL